MSKSKDNKEQSNNRVVERVKLLICISASLLVVLLTTLYVLITFRFKDNNRSSYQSRGVSYSEIVQKNYIEGFENTKLTRKFSYKLPNEDINELLSSGVDSLNNKHIQNIYYDYDEQGLRYFFVDLSKVGVKTRVVITTTPSVNDNSSIKLSIASLSMGKVDALNLIKSKGYLSKEFIDPYFKECHLPISFDEDSLSFIVKPYSWVSMFPDSCIGNEIFSSSKDIEGAYSFNSNVFGFDLDLSKLSSNKEYIEVDGGDTPSIYEEVKTGCLSGFPSMDEGDTKVMYSLSEEGFNKHIKSSYVSNSKEEITSTLTSKKVTFDLVGSNVHLDQIDKITFTLFFNVNGYILGIDTDLTLNASSETFFGCYFAKPNISSEVLNESLVSILTSLGSEYTYFEYTSSEMLYLNLESLNSDPDITSDIKFSKKAIEINPASKSIEFKLTK